MVAKLRTPAHLDDAIDREISWRKRELSLSRLAVQGARAAEEGYLIRSGIALTYAHWEGWVQSVSRLYLDFVNQQKVPYRELSPALLGGALKTRISQIDDARKARVHTEFARFVVEVDGRESAQISLDLIQTNSNLSSSVVADVLERVGLPANLFELSSNFIDSDLVSMRNGIAHGERVGLTRDEFLALSERIASMLEEFTDLIRNAANCGEYRVREQAFLGSPS